jgi:HrpA-like RNA helicase
MSIAIFNPNPHLEIQEQRKLLPIYYHKTQLQYLIDSHQITILIAPTGSGKTTQLPQYMLHTPKNIVVTLPYGCQQIARRVSLEMDAPLNTMCCYSLPFDINTAKITFTTDQMLLSEMQHDPLLTRYSLVILDDAHLLTLNTNILLGLMKRYFF